jgi:hypothetical protein
MPHKTDYADLKNIYVFMQSQQSYYITKIMQSRFAGGF